MCEATLGIFQNIIHDDDDNNNNNNNNSNNNVKLSLCLTKHHVMNMLGEWRCSSTHSWSRHYMDV